MTNVCYTLSNAHIGGSFAQGRHLSYTGLGTKINIRSLNCWTLASLICKRLARIGQTTRGARAALRSRTIPLLEQLLVHSDVEIYTLAAGPKASTTKYAGVGFVLTFVF